MATLRLFLGQDGGCEADQCHLAGFTVHRFLTDIQVFVSLRASLETNSNNQQEADIVVNLVDDPPAVQPYTKNARHASHFF